MNKLVFTFNPGWKFNKGDVQELVLVREGKVYWTDGIILAEMDLNAASSCEPGTYTIAATVKGSVKGTWEVILADNGGRNFPDVGRILSSVPEAFESTSFDPKFPGDWLWNVCIDLGESAKKIGGWNLDGLVLLDKLVGGITEYGFSSGGPTFPMWVIGRFGRGVIMPRSGRI